MWRRRRVQRRQRVCATKTPGGRRDLTFNRLRRPLIRRNLVSTSIIVLMAVRYNSAMAATEVVHGICEIEPEARRCETRASTSRTAVTGARAGGTGEPT